MIRILVVEDDGAQRILIDTLLRRAGYEAQCAASADDALDLLETDSQFAAILTDFRMPGMAITEFLSILNVHYPTIPVIVMTVHAGSLWVDEALRNGAVTCLAKPFFGPQLIQTLESSISRQTVP
jgi:CheY-like chemotaxis protein